MKAKDLIAALQQYDGETIVRMEIKRALMGINHMVTITSFRGSLETHKLEYSNCRYINLIGSMTTEPKTITKKIKE